MEFNRRRLLRVAGLAAAVPIVSRVAAAQSYPSRPVRLIAGFPPGGAVDVIARLIAQWLSERLGRSFIVENRPGAGSNLATEEVVRAPPDGYTLLECGSANAWNTALYDNLKFDFVRDIAPVASIYRGIGVLVVRPSFPAKTLSEFIQYLKSNPGKFRMASGGIGSSQHLYGKLFEIMTGVQMLHVPYRGGAPALNDLLGAHVDIMFDTLITSMAYIKSDQLRVVAVTSATRWPALPDVPAIAEFVPGYEADGWQGIGAPRDTPVQIIELLNKEVTAALADPGFSKRLSDLGGAIFASSPADFRRFVADYTDKWGKVIRTAGIKAD
jgi:tripartite-type tricarboxylate transporter receptor subunit TctC